MRIVTRPDDLGPFAPCVLVPTMGALHAGHAALVAAAARDAGELPVVVTVFVNPTQFDDAGDYARYPRTLDADAAIARDAGAHAVFAPAPEDVYPAGMTIEVPPLPDCAVDRGLEDAHRPGHFAGVCQVVLRLFRMTRARRAIFGEKDWQQLQTVRAMTRERGLAVEIVPHPTVREPDGVAMSSRNRFLSAGERRRAPALQRALRLAAAIDDPAQAEAEMRRTLVDAGLAPDYAAVRDAETLGPIAPGRPGRALIAARFGSVRLLDNAPWPA